MVQQVTNGIKISVTSNFEGTNFRNHTLYYGFSYEVTIENQSNDTVQLLERQWKIFDSLSKTEIVIGSGVVGQKAEFTWVIDPINGISNFVNGVPQFGIMIGVLYKNVPLAGGICLPYYSKILSAEKNEGAFCNGDLIHVTKESELSQTLTGFHIGGQQLNPGSMRAEVREIGELLLCMTTLRISSLSYDISLVAQGNYGGYVSKSGTILDTVAPHIIIEEAGGIYTDFYGENIRYLDVLGNISRNYTCCTASPSLHKQLQSVIHAK